MKIQVNSRPIKPLFCQALKQSLWKTWSYEGFTTKKNVKRISKSKTYLCACLMNRKFACNALTDNEPIDIFMTKAKRNESFALRYLLSYVNSILGVIVSKEGRKVISKFKVIAFMDQKFFSQSKLHFGGELDYVGVRTDQRGGGLDKKLFHKCMEYLDRQNMKSFYFFTDSTCNVGFYKHQGMSQIGGQRDALKFLERGELALYLFASNSPGRLCQ